MKILPSLLLLLNLAACSMRPEIKEHLQGQRTSSQSAQYASSEESTTKYYGKFQISFEYPSSWKLEEASETINLFNSLEPYTVTEHLKDDVMKAQFLFGSGAPKKSAKDFLKSYLPNPNLDYSALKPEFTQDRIKFYRFPGKEENEISYLIPKQEDYSEFIFISVWNHQNSFEEVLQSVALKNT